MMDPAQVQKFELESDGDTNRRGYGCSHLVKNNVHFVHAVLQSKHNVLCKGYNKTSADRKTSFK